jgi:hypothetical protein
VVVSARLSHPVVVSIGTLDGAVGGTLARAVLLGHHGGGADPE